MKPLGIFGHAPGPADRPHWAQFALLPDDADFAQAAEDSARTGIKWVLYLYSMPREAPLADVLPGLVARIEESGIRPHLVGVAYHEEWYAAFKSGKLPIPGLSIFHSPDVLSAAKLIDYWVSLQHNTIKQHLPGLAVVWLDTFVNDDTSFGGYWYQPVPDRVDALAIEAYVPRGGSWAADVEPFLQHAVSTRTEPIVLVIQGFRAENDPQWCDGPTEDGHEGVRRWLDHPRVLSGWVFDWASRPGSTGLRDLPQRRDVETSMGVQ